MVAVECAAVVRARRRSEVGVGRGHAAIDDQALVADAHLEGQAAGMGVGRNSIGGGRPASTMSVVVPASMR